MCLFTVCSLTETSIPYNTFHTDPAPAFFGSFVQLVAPAPPANKWTHVAVTWSADEVGGEATMLVDGKPLSNQSGALDRVLIGCL